MKNSTKTKSIAKNDDDLIDSLVNEAMSNLDTKVDASKLIKNNESKAKKNNKPIKTAATYLPAKKKWLHLFGFWLYHYYIAIIILFKAI